MLFIQMVIVRNPQDKMYFIFRHLGHLCEFCESQAWPLCGYVMIYAKISSVCSGPARTAVRQYLLADSCTHSAGNLRPASNI